MGAVAIAVATLFANLRREACPESSVRLVVLMVIPDIKRIPTGQDKSRKHYFHKRFKAFSLS
jgi:hypothetical protein